MQYLKDIIEKLLNEVDPDIREAMLADSKNPTYSGGRMYKMWEMIESPMAVITQWQLMREMKKQNARENLNKTNTGT